MEVQTSPPYERAGPSLLAQAAANPAPAPTQLYDAEWSQLYAHNEARLSSLRDWRLPEWRTWALLAQYILPRRYQWLITANNIFKGSMTNPSIINETGTIAMEIAAAGLMAGLMTGNWFILGAAMPGDQEPDQAAQEWLQDTQERMYEVLAESNAYPACAQAFQDICVFGPAPLIIYEDPEDVVRFYGPCAGEYYLGTGFRFTVDTLYREFVLTIAQIIEGFGEERVPEQVLSLWRTKGGQVDTEMVVAHAIEPNYPLMGPNGQSLQVVRGGAVWREVYWLKGQKTPRPLSLRGFAGNDKPFVAPRAMMRSNEAYGRSFGMNALGSIMQLQTMEVREGEAIEKHVRPPLKAHVSMKNEPSSTLPGHVTYVPSMGTNEGIAPIFTVNPNIEPLSKKMEKVEARIQRCFYTDVFMMLAEMEGVQPRNELEIAERKGEKIQRLGPMVDLWKREMASPMLQRVMNIMGRRRLIRPMPDSLRQVGIKITYDSIIERARRAVETAAMKETLVAATTLSAAAKNSGAPDPLDELDLDEVVREIGKRNGTPPKVFRPPDKVEHMRQAREQGQQAAQAAQLAGAAADSAHTLSQTPLGGQGTALDAMLGTPQGRA